MYIEIGSHIKQYISGFSNSFDAKVFVNFAKDVIIQLPGLTNLLCSRGFSVWVLILISIAVAVVVAVVLVLVLVASNLEEKRRDSIVVVLEAAAAVVVAAAEAVAVSLYEEYS